MGSVDNEKNLEMLRGSRVAEISGAIMESESLDESVMRLTKKVNLTKAAAIVVWVACIVTFLARFCMG